MNVSSILVAIDSYSGSRPVIKTAIDLAMKLNAEVRAMYIEDDQWFEVSKFSFSQQISSFTGQLLPFSETSLAEESKALGSLLENMLSSMSRKVEVKFSYRSIRGIVDQKLLEAASESDLMVIGRNRYPARRSVKVGRTSLHMAKHCKIPLLIWNNGVNFPVHLTGLCKEPGESFETIKWSILLSEKFEGVAKLIWDKQHQIDKDSLIHKKLERIVDDPVSVINRISEIRPGFTPERYRAGFHELLIFQRSIFDPDLMQESIRQIPNSMLLL